MGRKNTKEKVTIDNIQYVVSDLTENAKSNVHNIHFVDSQIKELSNKLAVAETARMAYSSALKNELTLEQSEG